MGAEIDQSRPAAAGRAPRVRPVNGFRVFALFGVVIIHLIGVSGFFAAHPGSNASVAIWSVFGNSLDIFFIISGFVLFLPVIRRGGELGDKWAFWVGRGARLLPAFWLVLAIMVLLVAVKPPGPDYRFPTVLELAAHIPVMQLPVQLHDSGFRIGFGINGPLWMLSIVVSFYALLPFIARAWYRHPLIGLAIGHHPPLVRIPARGWIEGGCCGRALRRRRTFRRKPRRRRRRAPERARPRFMPPGRPVDQARDGHEAKPPLARDDLYGGRRRYGRR